MGGWHKVGVRAQCGNYHQLSLRAPRIYPIHADSLDLHLGNLLGSPNFGSVRLCNFLAVSGVWRDTDPYRSPNIRPKERQVSIMFFVPSFPTP